MAKPIRHSQPRSVPLDALVQGSDSLSYHVPSQLPQNSLYGSREGSSELSTGLQDESGQGIESLEGQAGGRETQEAEAGRETGGRSDETFAAAQVTAKPLSPIPDPLSSLSSDHSSIELVKDTSNPDVIPQSDMPVLGDLRGVHRKEDPKVVQTSHVGGIHSKNGPVLSHRESDLVTTSLNIPYSPDVPEPLSTEEGTAPSPFITGNGRIDRRTAFTQYCRLGEGRTYIKVAEIMAVPLESIKEWAKEDNWENAYRERVTADIVQVAKEENIHEVLDIRREVIAQLKAKIQDSKNGKEVFKNTKEMLDTMLKLEELTGASSANSVKPGQIFVIIERSEWEAREKMNEAARKEEAKA